MPTFISFLNWTEQGIKNVKDAPKRAEAARTAHGQARGLHGVTASTSLEAPQSRILRIVMARGGWAQRSTSDERPARFER